MQEQIDKIERIKDDIRDSGAIVMLLERGKGWEEGKPCDAACLKLAMEENPQFYEGFKVMLIEQPYHLSVKEGRRWKRVQTYYHLGQITARAQKYQTIRWRIEDAEGNVLREGGK